MKKTGLLAVCFLLFACGHPDKRARIEKLMAGDEYKYWMEVSNSHDREAGLPPYVDILYLDRTYKRKYFYYSSKKRKFGEPKSDDTYYYVYWKFVNDSVIDMGGALAKIKLLTETDFIFDFVGYEYHYKPAPIDIIPKEYRKIQKIDAEAI